MSMRTLTVRNRAQWRAWLTRHHAREKEIWLLYQKKPAGWKTIGYEESVEEAICFGWVDSLIRKIDETRYARKFTPRTDLARWSALNKKRARKVIREGRMTAAGRAKAGFLRAGVRSERVPARAMTLRGSLLQVLRGNRKAWQNFTNLAPSYRRLYAGWIMSAKKQETRERRLREAIQMLEKNKKLGLK